MTDIAFRAGTGRPCPVCGTETKGCSATADGLHLCRGDARPGWRHLPDRSDSGFACYRRAGARPATRPSSARAAAPRDWPAVAARLARQLNDKRREELAGRLALPVAALDALPLLGLDGATTAGGTFAFPEVDAAGVVVGINRRFPDGSKKVLPGGKRGLTVPAGWHDRPGPVFLVEGASDVLALTAAGLPAVGRPSNAGGAELLAELLAGWPADRAVVVVGENDRKPDGAWPGRTGAEAVARGVAGRLGHAVLWALPPADAKDVRDWLTTAARGDAPWADRGAELAAHLTANGATIDPPAPPAPPAPGSSFQVGDMVTPCDRGNKGTVVAVAGGTVSVEFVGKDGVAVKDFAPGQLKPWGRAPGGGSPAGGRPAVPEYRPFPVDALPRTLREFVAAVSRWSDADPAFAALPALTVAGAAVGLAACASPKRKYAEPPLLWTCAVADSGTGKSPGLRPSADIALEIDRKLKARYAAAREQYEADLDAWKAAERPDPAARPARPQREYFYLIDTTIERLAENIGSSPRGVVVVRDELAGWFGSFTKYSGKVDGSDLPNWLSIFDAGPIRYHRRTGEPRDVEADRGFAAVCGGIQPGILRGVLGNPAFLDSGLAARLVFAMPPKACPGYTDDDLDPATEAAFAAVLDFLRELPFDPIAGPAAVGLDPAAKDRFRALCAGFAATAEGIDGGPMSAALPKAARLALRLALVWHCVECAASRRDPTRESIGDAAMGAGEVLARWFVGEAERVYAMLAEEPEDRSARLLGEWVRRKGGRATPRDLQRSNRKYGTVGEAEAALDALVAAGVGRWDEPAAPTGGRPAGRAFVLDPHPTADGRQKPTGGDDEPGAAAHPSADERPTGAPATPEMASENEVVSASVGRRPGTDGPDVPPDAAPTPPALSSAAPHPSAPSRRPWKRVPNDDRPPELRG